MMEDSPEPARRPQQRGVPTFAILLVIVGVVLLLQTLDVLDWRLWFELLRYWPVLLIVIGLTVLLGNRSVYLSAALVTLVLGGTVAAAAVTAEPRPSPVVTDRDFTVVAAFGSADRTVTSQEFRGGEAIAAFGSVNLDLRPAAIAGDRATLDVVSAFGSVEVRVPADWVVRVEGMAVLGSVEDHRRDPPSEGPILVMDGVAAFGSVRILD